MTAADAQLPPEPDLADLDELRWAADFPPATDEQWWSLAAAVLRRSGRQGVPAELSTVTRDGLELAPLYTAATPTVPTGAPGLAPFTRGATAGAQGWDVRQRHADPDPAASREAILADLENGVTSLWLVLGEAGLPVGALPEALDGVYLDLAGVALDAGAATGDAARALFALVEARGGDRATVRGTLGADPLGWAARTGTAPDFASLRDLGPVCAAGWPGLRVSTVDATAYHDAGATDAQELALSLATGVAYLRELTAAGLGVPEALGQLEFRYAATVDQFATVAKLRAARRLWARVADACGAAGSGAQRQHAVTSAAMLTARDPWVNMLRVTVACLAAGIGGADAATVLPFDARLGLPDAFARRIARNTQAVLLDEAGAGRVVDPAGGSWYVESRTEALARAAWALFTEVERAGGMAGALRSGLVAGWLEESWARRAEDLAHRREPVTGVSEYPNLTESRPVRRPAPPAPAGGLPRHWTGEAYEALRDRADGYAAAHGAPPTVFLVTFGAVAEHTARATFAANLFAAGGIAATLSGPVTDPATAAALHAATGAPLVCLCGDDSSYAELAAATAAALRPGATQVWLAGQPARFPGVDRYVHTGVDAVAALTAALDLLGA